MINTVCPTCLGRFYPIKDNELYSKCNCGTTKMTTEIINLNNYLTANGRYPDRLQSPELTTEVKDNAMKLLAKVNMLLNELGVTKADVTSGFRPSGINAKVKNAAKNSAHQNGMAVDLLDSKDQDLAKKITVELLEKYELYMESPEHTKGKNTNWVHLQIRPTKNRIFIP